MSNPRKDFDVKQILRIRWRWFGHPTSPPPGNQPSGDLFSGSRVTGGTTTGGDQPSLGGCGSSSPAAGASSSNGNSSSNINNNRKFGESVSNNGLSTVVMLGASACPRSMSQQECRSPSPGPWVFPAHSRSSESLEPLQQQQREPPSTRVPEAPGPGDDENNNHNVDSDTSSCRYGKALLQQGACT